MITYALIFAFGCFGFGLLVTLWRLLAGPSPADPCSPFRLKAFWEGNF